MNKELLMGIFFLVGVCGGFVFAITMLTIWLVELAEKLKKWWHN